MRAGNNNFKKKILFSTVPLLLLVFIKCITSTTGVVDETDTGKYAVLYNNDGSRAAGATVKVYNYHDTTLVLDTATDYQGTYSLAQLNGTYSIWAEKDSLVAYQDSVVIRNNNKNIARDTLKIPGSIKGRVILEQGDPLSSVIVHALGTHIYTNVNDSGYFTLTGLAEGSYTLQLSSTLPGYTTTFSAAVSVRSGEMKIVSQPLSLLFNGIPYVEGLTGLYDTLSGSILLTWNKSAYANFQDFIVYRRPGDFTALPFEQYAITSDTSVSDNFYPTLSFDQYSSYQYKVVIRDKFENEGRAYGYVTVKSCPVESVTTVFDVSPARATECIVNEEIELILTAVNPTRSLRKIRWSRASDTELLREITFTTKKGSIRDTLKFTPEESGNHEIFVTVTDDAGTEWNDTITVQAKHAYITIDTLTGIHSVSIRTSRSIKTIAVQFDAKSKFSLPVNNGVALCTLDTRTIYPPRNVTVVIESSYPSKDSSTAYVTNGDPLTGCWMSVKDTLVRECYHDDGTMESNREFVWLLGWERQGEKIMIHRATGDPIIFTPVFKDYNNCLINGLECKRTPGTQVLKKRSLYAEKENL